MSDPQDYRNTYNGSGPINFLFVAELAVVVVMTIFFFFFWSRVVGSVVAFAIRQYLWRSQKIWIEFDALQISPLAGHVLIKNFRYHSANMSVRVLHGRISWRYWLWRVRGEQGGPNGDVANEKLPTRIAVKVSGVEFFLYNRTAAYDAIISRAQEQVREEQEKKDGRGDTGTEGRRSGYSSGGTSETRKRTGWTADRENGAEEEGKSGMASDGPAPDPAESSTIRYNRPKPSRTSTAVSKSPTTSSPISSVSSSGQTDWFREILPLEIRILTGSVVMGNDATPTLAILAFGEARGMYSAEKARSKHDTYKEMYKFNLTQPKIIMRTNPDYRGPLADHGAQAFEDLKKQRPDEPPPTLFGLMREPFHALANKLRFLSSSSYVASKPSFSKEPWKGLPRYRAGETGDETRGNEPTDQEREYAKVTTVLDGPELDVTYFCDVAGPVPPAARPMDAFAGLEKCDVGNGDLAPEWGVEISIKGGIIAYGPWADRQRVALQQAFTPQVFANSQSTNKLREGDTRLHTSMKVWIEFSQETTMRIPIREASKDWDYDSKGETVPKPHSSRRYGWLAIKMGANSTIVYNMPMVSDSRGFRALLEVHITELAIASSINGYDFLSATGCRILGSMPSPLVWNAHRDWVFDVSLDKPKVFLIRDHVTLLTDLAKDWTSGPGGDYFHFVPVRYIFKLALNDFSIYLNLNDHNIIDHPTSLEENVFLILKGPRADVKADIPSTKYRPKSSAVSFSIEASNVDLELSLPVWNTHAAFATERTKSIGTIGLIQFDGSYVFFSETHPDHVETLTLDILTRGIVFKMFGWAIRHLLRVKDNYFGAFTNFSTLEEYNRKKDKQVVGDLVSEKYRPGCSDVFELVLTLVVQDGAIVLPESMYDCKRAFFGQTPELQISLRLHDYYMEMVLDLMPSTLFCGDFTKGVVPDGPESDEEVIMIDGLQIIGDRLFGPQPRTAVYLCLWEVSVGRLNIQATPSMLLSLQKVGKSIGSNFSDAYNSPPPSVELAADPDITFFKLNLSPLDATVWTPGSAINFALPEGLSFDSNDLGTTEYRSMMSIGLPRLDLRILLPPASRRSAWWEVSAVSFDISTDIYSSPFGWQDSVAAQAAFVKSQDLLTHRLTTLYDKSTDRVPASHANSLYLPPPLRSPRQRKRPSFDSLSETSSTTTAETDSVRSMGSEPSEPDGISQSFHTLERRRSASFVTAYEDNDSISSGDESDDPSSSASSASSTSTTSGVPRRWSILPHSTLAALLDRFRVRRPGEEVSCDIPTIEAADPTSTRSRAKPEAPTSKQPAPPNKSKKTPAARQTYRSSEKVIRLKSKNGIRVLFTPLSLVAIEEMLTGFNALEFAPEELLDELFQSPAPVGPAESTPETPARFVIDVDISSVGLRMVQRVLEAAEVQTIAKGSTAHRGFSAVSDLYAVITYDSQNIRLLFNSSTHHETSLGNATPTSITSSFSSSLRTTFDVSFVAKSAVLQVRHATRLAAAGAVHAPLPAVEQGLVVLQLATKGIEITATSASGTNLISLTVGDSDLDWLNVSSELIIGTVHEVLVFAGAVDRLNDRISTAKAARSRGIVWAIIKSAQTAKLQTASPCLRPGSFLVQASPARSDRRWRALVRLRYALRMVGENRVLSLAVPGKMPTDEGMARVCLAAFEQWRLDSYGPEEGGISLHPILVSLFPSIAKTAALDLPPQPTPPPPTHSQLLLDIISRPSSFTFTTGCLSARHQDHLGPDSIAGLLSLGPYLVTSRIWLEQAPRTKDGSPSTILHLALQSSLGQGTAEITPALLLVIRHIIRVRQIFETKMIQLESTYKTAKTAKPPKPPSGPPMDPIVLLRSLDCRRIVLEACLAFEQASIDLEVRDLAVNLSSRAGLFASSLAFDLPLPGAKKASLPPKLASSILLRLDRFNVSALEVIPREDHPSERRTLVALDIGGADSRLSLDDPSLEGKPTNSRAVEGKVSVVIAVDKVRSSAPANIARLFSFAQRWKSKTFPTYESIVREIIRDLDLQPTETNPSGRRGSIASLHKPPSSQLALSIDANILLKRLDFDIRVTPQLWVCWSLLDVLAFSSVADISFRSTEIVESGLQFGSQSLRFVPTSSNLVELPPRSPSTMEVKVPAVQVSAKFTKAGEVDSNRLELLVTLAFIDLTLHPEVLDSLLAVMHQIGRDITELVDLLVDARKAHVRSKSTSAVSPVPDAEPTSTLQYSARLALRGFKVGLRGASSTQYFEGSLLQGKLSSPRIVGEEMAWSFNVSELSLSLDHTPLGQKSIRSSEEQRKLSRQHRSAILTLEIAVQNAPFDQPGPSRKSTGGKPELRHLHLRLDRVHAVVEAAALGQLGDLVEQYSDELTKRSKARAVELEEFRASTQRVWEADDEEETPVIGAQQEAPAPSWLDDRLVSLQITSIGFAFPLARPSGGQHSALAPSRSSVPAFLFSVETIDFSTQRYETGKASIRDACAQFVPSFDQSKEPHFHGLQHETHNRILFPRSIAEVQAQSDGEGGPRQVWVQSSVSGFELSLDSTLPGYVFALLDVYQKGKDRIDRLSAQNAFDFYSSAAQDPEAVPDTTPNPSPHPSSPIAGRGLDVKASFEFQSGTVSFFSYKDVSSTPSTPAAPITSNPQLPNRPEVLTLPTVTLWAEYHDFKGSAAAVSLPTSPTIPGGSEPRKPSILFLNMVVSGTQNTLNPDMLPFFTQLTNAIEHRPSRQASTAPPSPDLAPRPLPVSLPSSKSLSASAPPASDLAITPPAAIGNTQINFSLRIDKSVLIVRCSTSDPAEAVVTWESGGCLLSLAPGFREISLATNIAGVTASFRRVGDASCLQVRAQDLSLAVLLSPLDEAARTNDRRRVVSITLDTELSARFDFHRMWPLLCLKAVWLDRIPVPVSAIPKTTSSADPPIDTASSSTILDIAAPTEGEIKPSPTTFLVLARVRRIKLDVNSPISNLAVGFSDIVFSSKLSGGVKQARFSIKQTEMRAAGQLSGYARLPLLLFETEKCGRDDLSLERPRLVSVRLSTGLFECSLAYDQKTILKMSLGPVRVSIVDDWTGVGEEKQIIGLTMSVDVGHFELIFTIRTVAKLFAVAAEIKKSLDFSVNYATNFSKTFKAISQAKPDNTLSDVANSMYQNARTRFKTEAERGCFSIVQEMVFQAQGVRAIIYPHSVRDLDFARLDLGILKARLVRELSPGGPPRRVLDLRVTSALIRRWTPKTPFAEKDELTPRLWIEQASSGNKALIFELPPMTITMDSVEHPERTIKYDYSLLFDGALDLSLNYGHFKWLQGVGKDFLAELKHGSKRLEEINHDSDSSASSSAPNGKRLKAAKQHKAASVALARTTSSSPPSSDFTALPSISSSSPPPSSQPPSSAAAKGKEPAATGSDRTSPSGEWTFIKGKQVIQEIRVTHLGDATPSKNWWRLAKYMEDSATYVHEIATMQVLEPISEGLLEMYKKQLSNK